MAAKTSVLGKRQLPPKNKAAINMFLRVKDFSNIDNFMPKTNQTIANQVLANCLNAVAGLAAGLETKLVRNAIGRQIYCLVGKVNLSGRINDKAQLVVNKHERNH